ncbi:ADP-ribosylation factor-like protein 6-interacting protein 1 [Dinothrombium tinctorium]|uniref:ADP-ribosylation factor-like protein 6-interacting protein 1 n=1 Tax=Dinothrombium tinctorium TaxID=1965070 RepID=A0A443RKF4_9ACAR|nr:ADP-ribosylation factor-like protein 6-interacting protein 1 [Dinothrombium tinctorium]
MAENVPDSSEHYAETNLEELAERVKRNLVAWKQPLVLLHKLFIWEQQFYPVLLSAFVSLVFSIIWLCDASILTTFSVLGIVLFLCDYFVPLVCNNFLNASNWDAKHEKVYSDICTELALGWVTLVSTWHSWQKLKDAKPKAYFLSLLTVLMVLAWIGNLINNLFLTYLLALFVALLPGLKHHGILQKYVGQCVKFIQKSLGVKDKTK